MSDVEAFGWLLGLAALLGAALIIWQVASRAVTAIVNSKTFDRALVTPVIDKFESRVGEIAVLANEDTITLVRELHETMSIVRLELAHIRAELKTNGGDSVKDRVLQTTEMLADFMEASNTERQELFTMVNKLLEHDRDRDVVGKRFGNPGADAGG